MKAHGYDGFDYQGLGSVATSPLYKMSEEELFSYLDNLKACAQKNGLAIHQLHGPFPCEDFATEEGRQRQLEHFKKGILGAERLGCKKMVIHPWMPGLETNSPSEDEIPLNIRLLKQLAPFARAHGVTVCLENVAAPNGTIMSYIESVKKVLDGVDDEYIKSCLDTGHFNAVGKDIYSAIKLLGGHLAALHVHDDRYGQDRHLWPYQGEVDWDGFTRGLKEISFQGVISLETQVCSGMPQPMREKFEISLAKLARLLADKVEDEGGEV
jgi:sugar phosphate isomerase/epimerase